MVHLNVTQTYHFDRRGMHSPQVDGARSFDNQYIEIHITNDSHQKQVQLFVGASSIS